MKGKFPCQRCKKFGLRVGVNLFLDIPDYMYAGLSKKALQNKEVHINGAGWDRAYFYCKCGWNTHLSEGQTLQNEVSRLWKMLEENGINPTQKEK